MFHDNLITRRKMKNMTQEDIADIVGVSRQSVAKWETGETVPDLDKCKKLAEIFERGSAAPAPPLRGTSVR